MRNLKFWVALTAAVFAAVTVTLALLSRRPFGADWHAATFSPSRHELRDLLEAPDVSPPNPAWGTERMEVISAGTDGSKNVELRFHGIGMSVSSLFYDNRRMRLGYGNPGPLLPIKLSSEVTVAGTRVKLEGVSLWGLDEKGKRRMLAAYDEAGHAVDEAEARSRGWVGYGTNRNGLNVPAVWIHLGMTDYGCRFSSLGIVSSDARRSAPCHFAYTFQSIGGRVRTNVGLGAFRTLEDGTRYLLQLSCGPLESVTIPAGDMSPHALGAVQVRRLGSHPMRIGSEFGLREDIRSIIMKAKCEPAGATDWVVSSVEESPSRILIRNKSTVLPGLPRLAPFPRNEASPVDLVVERRVGAARLLVDADIGRLFRDRFPKNLFDTPIRVSPNAGCVGSAQMATDVRTLFGIFLPTLDGYEKHPRKFTPKDGMTLRELIADYFAPVREAGDGVSWNPATSSFEIEKPWTTRLFATIRRWWRDATGAP